MENEQLSEGIEDKQFYQILPMGWVVCLDCRLMCVSLCV